MLKLLLSTIFLFGFCIGGEARSHGGAPSIPSFAAANLSKIIFFEQFNNTNNIDLAQTVPAGKNWYTTNQLYGNPAFSGCPTLAAPSPSWFTAANGVLNISTNNSGCAGAEVMSLGWNNSTKTTTENFSIPASGGFYIEGRMQFVPSSNSNLTPDFWIEDRTLAANTFAAGGGTGAGGCEIDVFEAFNAPGQTTAIESHVNIWTAPTTLGTSTAASYDASGIDFTKYHLFGVLLTTMAQGGGTGSVQFYIDRVAVGSPITWTNGSTNSVCETANFDVNFAAQSSPIPLNVNYIIVYGP